MNDRLSLSIFAIEIDGKPTLVLAAKRHSEVECICEQQWFRADLTSLKSNDVPLCDANSIFRARLAHSEEAATYRQTTEAAKPSHGINIVYLVDVDDGGLF
jgi:AICAR transformylase/IMP cyclohydrolase PurH